MELIECILVRLVYNKIVYVCDLIVFSDTFLMNLDYRLLHNTINNWIIFVY